MSTLQERLRQIMSGPPKISQAALARACGIKPPSVNDWISGKTKTIEGQNLLHAAEFLKVTPMWLATGRGPMRKQGNSNQPASNATMIGPISVWDDETPLDDDEVYVPFLKEVELSAGSGRTVIETSSSRKLRFGKQTLRNQGVQFDNAVCVTVHGNSMEPVLPDGSTVGVDTSSVLVKDGKMYAVDHGGELRVKTLYRTPGGGLRFRSFNHLEHPDEEYSAEDLADKNINVLGKVFWYSVLL